MEKGDLLGKGMTAEVYSYGEGKVVKLFNDRFSNEWVKHEAEIGRKIHEAGVPSPAVFDTVEIEGRQGIIFERIDGKTMTSTLMKHPWLFSSFVQQLAEFQHNIHKHSAEGIPSQKEKFTRAITVSSEILGDKVHKIMEYLEGLPEGDSICHGDLYLSNIMISKDRFVVIDWSSAYRGDPAGDVARTCLIINSPAVLPGTPDILASMSIFPKKLTYMSYINEYLKAAKIKYKDIDAWMLPVAAVKLKDRIPGEEKWLMKIINERLEQINGVS